MIDDKDILVEGERRLGRYTIVLLQQTSTSRWSPSVMQLDATVTNYRLMLRPFKKKYTPASLPSHYMKHIELTQKGRYHCIEVTLITNHLLCLMLSTGRLSDLFDDMHAMMRKPPKFQFDDTVARDDIQRLITFFGREPLPDVSN